VHVTSDLLEVQPAVLRWRLESLDGELAVSGEARTLLSPLADTAVEGFDFADRITDKNRRSMVFVCELWDGEERIAANVTPFAPNKHLALADPGLKADVMLRGDTLAIDVSARSLARFVELELDGTDVVFSDNYFDLPAGQSVSITCPLPAGWTLERARQATRLRSLRNSYE
jgi:beta-mannosidase